MSDMTNVETYQAPVIVEVGEFADLTRITDKGGYIDNHLVSGWWDP